MNIYMCKWKDGTCSIVNAVDEDEAVMKLDEISDPSDIELIELDELLLTLVPAVSEGTKEDSHIYFEIEGLGEDTVNELMDDMYPKVDNALGMWYEDETANDTIRPDYLNEAIKEEMTLL